MRNVRYSMLRKCIYCISPFLLLMTMGFFPQENWDSQSNRQISPIETSERISEPKGSTYTILATDSLNFSAKGLSNEILLMNIFKGDFINIPFDRDEQLFSSLYSAYLNSYARKCGNSLPSNKVEMTREECATEEVTTNGFGVEVSRNCVRWVTVGTGLYAKPEMYTGKLALEKIQSADTFRNIFGMISQDNGMEGMMNMVGDVQAVLRDMDELLVLNECNGNGLSRFEENLKLFALNKQPISLTNTANEKPTISLSKPTTFKDQNYQELIDDLIADHSKGWVMNRYEKGRVTNVSVASRDDNGRPATLKANYVFSGFSDRSNGAVTLTFTNGLPECMYFFDFPNTCRTPNRRIVAAYDNYGYAQ